MHLFAHSTGAYVGAHYAMAHPSRVKRLVLHGIAGLGSHPLPAADADAAPAAAESPSDHPSSTSKKPTRKNNWLWDAGLLNFGMLQRLGRLAKEPGRKRFHTFQGYRAGLTDEVELNLLYEYFFTRA